MSILTVSKEHRIYLALWRRAYKNPGTEVSIQASSYSMALTMRQGFYRAIKPYRSGKSFDTELAKAAELYVVSVIELPDRQAPHTVRLKPRDSLVELEASLLGLDLSPDDLLLPEEKTLVASTTEAEALSPGIVTPFYKR